MWVVYGEGWSWKNPALGTSCHSSGRVTRVLRRSCAASFVFALALCPFRSCQFYSMVWVFYVKGAFIICGMRRHIHVSGIFWKPGEFTKGLWEGLRGTGLYFITSASCQCGFFKRLSHVNSHLPIPSFPRSSSLHPLTPDKSTKCERDWQVSWEHIRLKHMELLYLQVRHGWFGNVIWFTTQEFQFLRTTLQTSYVLTTLIFIKLLPGTI